MPPLTCLSESRNLPHGSHLGRDEGVRELESLCRKGVVEVGKAHPDEVATQVRRLRETQGLIRTASEEGARAGGREVGREASRLQYDGHRRVPGWARSRPPKVAEPCRCN